MKDIDILDIDEKYLYENYPKAVDLLLIDNTTKKNIIWATDSYKKFGYEFNDNMYSCIIGEKNFIKPRAQKTKGEQVKRSKNNAEVFTPSWICNLQNNIIDNEWFNKKDVFNKELKNGTWETNKSKIKFPNNKTWIDYVKDIRLEITCGENPYIVSRYDTVTGNTISLIDRIGIFDRKLRIVNENAKSKKEWIKYSLEALKAIYGYEWQGDNLLLARENVLLSYLEYYFNKFKKMPNEDLIIEVTNIISWNLWQMDGLKCVIPCSCNNKAKQTNSSDKKTNKNECVGCKKENAFKHNGVYSNIMDWEKNKKIRFVDLLKGGKKYNEI